ncbi:MAG TPA: HlyD family efflux transporter periplasmic adaptor subunit [Alphaproteobacteria bacterium]|nr:HlyD family efflux transporter periplasmic adaptor subunit [Alphaproteobacteria bacterium]
MANPFEFAEAAQPLMRIAANERLQAQILIPSLWLQWLKTGTELTLRITETGKTYPAKIIRIGGDIDPVSQSIPITAELTADNPELLPGMSGSAIFKVMGATPEPAQPAVKKP